MSAGRGLELARKKFRCLSFDKIQPNDLKNNKQKGTKNAMFDKTQSAKFGCCDAFISHSWSDNGAQKYEALRSWAEEFQTTNGRQPLLWLDKACIDQNNISNDLMCLPVFLAGCERLLIIAGPTYVERYGN